MASPVTGSRFACPAEVNKPRAVLADLTPRFASFVVPFGRAAWPRQTAPRRDPQRRPSRSPGPIRSPRRSAPRLRQRRSTPPFKESNRAPWPQRGGPSGSPAVPASGCGERTRRTGGMRSVGRLTASCQPPFFHPPVARRVRRRVVPSPRTVLDSTGLTRRRINTALTGHRARNSRVDWMSAGASSLGTVRKPRLAKKLSAVVVSSHNSRTPSCCARSTITSTSLVARPAPLDGTTTASDRSSADEPSTSRPTVPTMRHSRSATTKCAR